MFKLPALVAFLAILSLTNPALAEDAKGTTDDHKTEAPHKHKHGKKCGHKAEKHGDHTDYEHAVDGKVHHHKQHDKHFDECEGPEAEAATVAPAAH